jgi:hypothetical protein
MTFREIVVGPLFLLLMFTAVALAGCASLSGGQCRSGDWGRIGRDDGVRGVPVRTIEDHREACARHGVTPDEARYRAAHAQGLQEYCTPAGGYVAGRRGDGYNDVCSAALEEKFLPAYRRGRELSYRINEVRDLRRRIDELGMAAMSGDYSDAQRTELRFRIAELERTLRLRQWDVERLDRQYAREFGAPELTPFDLRG